MGLGVPVVEVALEAHPLAFGAQTANEVPVTSPVGVHVRAEHVPELLVAALVDQVQVDLPDRGQEAVGVVGQMWDSRRRR